jgi:anthranilate synthase component 1
MSQTSRAEFAALVNSGQRVITVSREVFADGDSPVSLYRRLTESRPGSFLLESAEQGGIWSRFSFLGVESFGTLTDVAGRPHWINYSLDSDVAFGGPVPALGLDALSALTERWASSHSGHIAPLTGGLVGFIGWDAVRQLERLPHVPPTEVPVPGQALNFVRDLIVIDHRTGTLTLVTNVLAHESSPDFDEAIARIDKLENRLRAPHSATVQLIDLTISAEPEHRTTRDDYLASVLTSKEFIVAGDIFQVVISQRFELECRATTLDVYRVLRSLNPSPYMYLLSCEAADGTPYAVVGSSPEALVKVHDGRVFTHPIAGSRPRGASPEVDLAFEAELLADEKERAEHLMLVDLSRNDLLRVCDAGSVEVTEFMRVERFSHIMHIVSSVEGNLRAGHSAVDVFRATFPAGTLSGAPKPRALEIIDELEPAGRGVYGGVVGYFDFAGNADLAIAIRTATIVANRAYVQAGGGFVADSDPEAEFQESVNKAAAPLRAVAIANALVEQGSTV